MTFRLGTLELGRFAAALAVMLSHWLGVLGEHAAPGVAIPAPPGPLGVEYFFVLSGFVMMTSHHQDAGALTGALRFWARRACRIYPLYWVVLLLTMALAAAPWPGDRGMLALAALEPRLLPEIIAPAWSLRYETAFYLMFGLCLFPAIGRVVALGWGVAVLSLLVPPALWPHPLVPAWRAWEHWLGRWNHFVSLFEVYFFAGLLAGWMFTRARGFAVPACLAGAALLLYGLDRSAWGYAYPPPVPLAVLALGYGGIIYGLAALERTGRLLTGRWAKGLGALSYPLYLVHAPLVYEFSRFLPPRLGGFEIAAGAMLGAAISIAAAAILAYALDRPLQRALRQVRTPEFWRRAPVG